MLFSEIRMTSRIAQLMKLLDAEPDDAFCLYSLAQEHARAGEPQEAIAFYDRTIAADPSYCYAFFHKARLQEEAGDVAGARQTLEAGLTQARAAGDAKAIAEIEAFLDEIA
jgi:tetratricopeptide (TPR) repeat protein